jgi:hypothetical protein
LIRTKIRACLTASRLAPHRRLERDLRLSTWGDHLGSASHAGLIAKIEQYADSGVLRRSLMSLTAASLCMRRAGRGDVWFRGGSDR